MGVERCALVWSRNRGVTWFTTLSTSAVLSSTRFWFNTKLAIDWCKRHPQWRLSMQTHKYLNIP